MSPARRLTIAKAADAADKVRASADVDSVGQVNSFRFRTDGPFLMTDGTVAGPVATHSPPERIIEGQLDDQLTAIEKCIDGLAMSFFGPLLYGTEDQFRDATEALRSEHPGTSKVLVIL